MPPLLLEEAFVSDKPGTELLSRGATPKVSSPLQRFTSEFGMESAWFHCANRTRKTVGAATPEDCKIMPLTALHFLTLHQLL